MEFSLPRNTLWPCAISILFSTVLIGSCSRSDHPSVRPVPEEHVYSSLGENLDQYFSRIAPFGFSGAVLVARLDTVLLNKGYGLAVDSSATPNTSATVFGCASVTTQFTAAALMKLQMNGQLSTGDSLPMFLENVPEDKCGITLRQLLSHSAGIVNHTGEDHEDIDCNEVVRRALEAPLRFFPGTDFGYSDAGYSILAAVIEKVSGQSYEDYLHDHLFTPAGMVNTGYRRPNWQAQAIAHRYAGGIDNGIPLDGPYPSWNQIGNKDVLTTTSDLYRWHLAHQSDSILSPVARAELQTPVISDHAYGWEVTESPLGRLLTQDGTGSTGSSCEYRWYRDSGLVVILLCNRDYFGEPLFEAVNDHVERVLSGDTVELPPGLPAGSTADVSALVGTYRFPDGAEISLSAWNRGLIARGTDQRVIDLLYFPQIVSADTHAVLNHTIERCLLPILSGNWEPLGEILSDSETRLPRIRQLFEIMMSSRALESGPVERARIIGTYPSDRVPGAVETVAELYGAESHLFFRFIWEDNLVVGVGPTHERFCAETVLMPTSTDILVGYHLAGARPIRLAIIRDSAGRLTALTFADGESPVSAARIP